MRNDRKKKMLTCQAWLNTMFATPEVFGKLERRQHLSNNLHHIHLKKFTAVQARKGGSG